MPAMHPETQLQARRCRRRGAWMAATANIVKADMGISELRPNGQGTARGGASLDAAAA